VSTRAHSTLPNAGRDPIPAFATREDEAAFWDTHDFADYQEEFTPVRVRFAQNLSAGITIRLDPRKLEKLRQEAHQRGIGPTTLARMWILERLQETGEH